MFKSPEDVIKDAQDKILGEYEARRYLLAVNQRKWEREVAGEILLLQELFGIVPGEKPRFISRLRKCPPQRAEETP